jgi:predicted metal-dependent enzyme (double-stranded beta helix superfamily)
MDPKFTRRNVLSAAAGLAAAGGAASGAAVAQAGGSPRFDLERFTAAVRAANAEGQGAVEEVLARAVSDPAAILAALGEPSEVGPLPLYRSPDLTIINVVWAPLMVLPAHNHLMWASIGIYTGREDNILWRREGSVAEASGAASLSEGEVFSLPDDAIHSVVNPLGRLTAAIHIYGGDFFATQRSEWDPETLEEHPQDFAAVQQLFRDANARFQASQR